MRTFLFLFSVAVFGCGGDGSYQEEMRQRKADLILAGKTKSRGADRINELGTLIDPPIEEVRQAKKQMAEKVKLVDEENLKRIAKEAATKRSELPNPRNELAERIWKKLNSDPAEELIEEEHSFTRVNPELFENLDAYRSRIANQSNFQKFAENMKFEKGSLGSLSLEYGRLKKPNRLKALEISEKYKAGAGSFEVLTSEEKQFVESERLVFGIKLQSLRDFPLHLRIALSKPWRVGAFEIS